MIYMISILVFVAIFLGYQGNAMAKMTIFSEVTGRVLDNGKPVAGATIEREFRWAWGDEVGTDKTTTADDGSFHLPRIERSSFWGSILPHEPTIRQTIKIKVNGKTYDGWLYDKHNYDDKGERGGLALKLLCSLENTPQRHGDAGYGICSLE